jgi:molybdopterin/thiamine biosynthesis adenylyltransferase/rhodanese-related sulfurtransferase
MLPLPELSQPEIARYSRQLMLPEMGVDGQRRLKAGRVLVVGAGGLGSPAALYLAAAGVGTLGLVDFDTVDRSNLHRQILHGTRDVGRSKLASAVDRLADVNPEIDIRRHDGALTSTNALDIVRDYDVVVDGTDNFPARYLINDACVLLGKPNAYGAIFRFEGQASVFAAIDGPCYRCLFPEPPPPGLVPSCAEAGVLGVLPGVIGTIQATEAIKLLVGMGEPLIGRLLTYDALSLRFQELTLRKDPDCPVCGTHATIRELIDYDAFCGLTQPVAVETKSLPAPPDAVDFNMSPVELKARIDLGDALLLLDVREPQEYQIVRLPGGVLVPLGELVARQSELDPSVDIVVYCHLGIRSANATAYLRSAGFPRARNLTGGIDAWSREIDPTLARY